MTQEEILEYNKRCAEFLNLHRDEEVVIYNMRSHPYDFLKFHSDWNWIMEVILAINMLPNPKNPNDTTLQTHRTNVQSILRSANKEAVIQAINQFLIWYNESKTN